MIVLHVANLDAREAAGPNINVPKNIIYGNKFGMVGLYNLKKSNILFDIPSDRYFNIADYSRISDLPAPFNHPDIVVFQGMYEIKQCRVAKELVKRRIPYIVVPRCSMTTAAIKRHALKKSLSNALIFNKFIKNAEAIQFLTKNEYEESKNNFEFKEYFLLGNGVEIPTKKYSIKKRNGLKIVFIGRYNVYHKGLDVLLDAVENNKEWFELNDVSISLYGDDSDGGLGYLNRRIKKGGLENIVKLCGLVFGKEKEKALLEADVFIHASRLEGQPTSVMEAISYGVPVIVTPGTNVSDIVEKYNLGFISELGSNALFGCIKNAFLSKSEFPKICRNELLYAKNNFDWKKIVKEGLNEYAQLARGSNK